MELSETEKLLIDYLKVAKVESGFIKIILLILREESEQVGLLWYLHDTEELIPNEIVKKALEIAGIPTSAEEAKRLEEQSE
jgi:hypothetical protein